MAQITVKATGLKAIGLQFAGYLFRARRMPKRMAIEARGMITQAHHKGFVSRPRRHSDRFIQGVLKKQFFAGTGQKPPRLATIRRGLRNPPRPVSATKPMAKAVTEVLVAQFFGAKDESPEQVIRADIARQFRVGGDPKWEVSRDFGSLRAKRPTLGGAGGRVHEGWRGPYRETR